MRYVLFIALLTGVIAGAESIADVGPRKVETSEATYGKTAPARSTIMQSRIAVVKNTGMYNLLGKKYKPQQDRNSKKARTWHDQVVDLFR
jgi:hypothetical protein